MKIFMHLVWTSHCWGKLVFQELAIQTKHLENFRVVFLSKLDYGWTLLCQTPHYFEQILIPLDFPLFYQSWAISHLVTLEQPAISKCFSLPSPQMNPNYLERNHSLKKPWSTSLGSAPWLTRCIWNLRNVLVVTKSQARLFGLATVNTESNKLLAFVHFVASPQLEGHMCPAIRLETLKKFID